MSLYNIIRSDLFDDKGKLRLEARVVHLALSLDALDCTPIWFCAGVRVVRC